MTDSNLLELAKLGDPQAIETLMNQSLQPRGMRAAVSRLGTGLEVTLEAERVPNRQALTAFVQKGITNLGIQSIQFIRILGQQVGTSEPAWMQELQLDASLEPSIGTAPLNIQPETGVDITPIQASRQVVLDEIDPLEIASSPPLSPDPVDTSVPLLDLGESTDPSLQFVDSEPPNDLEALLPKQPSETSPNFLQELLAEPARAPAESFDPANDEGLLDFLNELSGEPASEAFPVEPAQEQAIFTEPSTAGSNEAEFYNLLAESSPLATEPVADPWVDLTEPTELSAGEPDADLLSFLNEPALDSVETLDSASDLPSQPSEFPEATSIDQLPNLFGEDEAAHAALEQPSEEFLSTLRGNLSEPEVEASAAINDLSSLPLNSPIEDRFSSEIDQPETTAIEEPWPEQPTATGEDLLQALVAEPALEQTNQSEEPFDRSIPEQPAAVTLPLEDEIAALDLTPDDFSPEPMPSGTGSAEPVIPQTFWSDDFSDAEVEEIPPDFLLEFQDESPLEFSDFVAAPLPETQAEPPEDFWPNGPSAELPRIDDFPAESPASSEPFSVLEEPSVSLEEDWVESSEAIPSSATSLEAELAALELDAPPTEEPLADGSAEAELYPLEPNLLALEDQDFTLEDQPTPEAIAEIEEGSDISQDALEAGLGDFRTEFVEPLPAEFFDEASQSSTDWQTNLRDPLALETDTEAAGYILEEDNPPEYIPPPIPDPSDRTRTQTPSGEGPPWIFITVLMALCALIAGLLGFSIFWSRVAPTDPPSPSEPPSDPTIPTPEPISPSSANPAVPQAKTPNPEGTENSPENTLTVAIDRASSAVSLSQAAQSADDWNLVVSKWQQAIELLQSVPNSSPDYTAAQQKLTTYQANLVTAQQKAQQPILAAVPLGEANIKTAASATSPIASPVGTNPTGSNLICEPVTTNPSAQPIELSRVQFDPVADQSQASPIVGCITNHTEQPIAAVNVVYKGNAATANAASETTGKLSFAQLDPRKTVPFKSEFTVVPEVKDLTIASIAWTEAGTSNVKQFPASINVVRSEKG